MVAQSSMQVPSIMHSHTHTHTHIHTYTHTPSQANYRCNPHHTQTIIIYLLMSRLWQSISNLLLSWLWQSLSNLLMSWLWQV